MSFQYFCVASSNNNAIFVGFSLICLESLGFLQMENPFGKLNSVIKSMSAILLTINVGHYKVWDIQCLILCHYKTSKQEPHNIRLYISLYEKYAKFSNVRI